MTDSNHMLSLCLVSYRRHHDALRFDAKRFENHFYFKISVMIDAPMRINQFLDKIKRCESFSLTVLHGNQSLKWINEH